MNLCACAPVKLLEAQRLVTVMYAALPCLLSSVGTGWIPSPIVVLIGSIRVKAVLSNCLAVGTPDP